MLSRPSARSLPTIRATSRSERGHRSRTWLKLAGRANSLKTSASAGIPGYVDSYIFAETAIPRGRAVETQEAANVAAFLLSPRSSGITAQQGIVDAGMSINYFDRQIVERVVGKES